MFFYTCIHNKTTIQVYPIFYYHFIIILFKMALTVEFLH